MSRKPAKNTSRTTTPTTTPLDNALTAFFKNRFGDMESSLSLLENALSNLHETTTPATSKKLRQARYALCALRAAFNATKDFLPHLAYSTH